MVGANASTVRAFGNLEVHASVMKVAEGVDYVGSVFKSLYGSVALRYFFSGTSCSLKSCFLTAKNNVTVQRDIHRLLQNGGGLIGKLELDMSVQIETRSGEVDFQIPQPICPNSTTQKNQNPQPKKTKTHHPPNPP